MVKKDNPDTIIIGGGIAGLYYAYKYLQGKSFKILEKSDYIGGRLKTSIFHKHSVVCGAGVGRWYKDILLKKLLKDLNIPFKKSKSIKNFLPKEVSAVKFINSIIATIKKYHKLHPNYSGSFRDIILKLFDKHILDNFIRINGYGDFVNEDFRETIYHYGLEDNLNMDIFSVPWDELVKKLINIIGTSNIKVNCCVKKIQDIGEVGNFTIHTNCGTYHNVKNIIIATDISFIHKIFPNNSLYKYVCGQSFSRIYAQFDVESINIMKNYIKGYTVVNGPLQKIIPMAPDAGIYMIAYNDNKNADATKNIKRQKLASLVETTIGHKVNIMDIKIFYWKIGTHYFKPYFWSISEWSKYLSRMQNPKKNIIVVGEAFSLNQGWVEGALESVEAVYKLSS